RSAQTDRLSGQARQGSGRLARLEVAVHLSRPGDCDGQSAERPGGHANQLRADLVGRHEQLLRAAARRPDLHDGRNGDAPASAGRPCRNLSGDVGELQRCGIFRHVLQRRCGSGRAICAVGCGDAHRWPGARRTDLCGPGQAEPGGRALRLSGRRSRPVRRHPERRNASGPSIAPQPSTITEGRKMNLPGKLTWDAIPFHEPIIMGTAGVVGLVIVFILGWVTVKGYVPYLWREWITSVDHKRIGVMYLVLALLMLVRGFADGIMMRSQQAVAAGGAQGYLPPEHYDQIFSAHGTIMIFFVAMPLVIGLMNFVVPLQLG